MAKPVAKAPELLEHFVADVQRSFREDRTIMSFAEYFELVVEEPRRHLRSSPQYMVDMFKHYGREELDLPTGKVTRYKVFDAPWSDGDGKVAGQEPMQEQLYRIIANFAREGRVNKLVLLHGPNGSAKSSMSRCLMAGMEAYSHLADGALYSFNWIFPSEKLAAGGIGFGGERKHAATAGDSYAYLPADSIDARVPAEMHDHPMFLIPQEQRVELLKKLLPEPEARQTDGMDDPQTTMSDYLRFGDLSYKSRKIYDALLASYDGDVQKVLNHVQVERIYLSKRYRRGLATIEPQMSVDARITQVTADRSLASLPKALQHTSLFEPSGPLVDANRGMLEFADLLKRPVEAFKYLLATVETATVSMDSFVLHLDMVFIASTNETYLDAFKEHPDFPSFKGRIELVKVPYLLRFADERSIYRPHITEKVVGRHIAPHAIDAAALWAVLTRMRKCDASQYPKDLRGIIDTLTPIEKLRLYDLGEVPERLTTRESKELRALVPALYKESLSYPNYEGRFGASAREIRTALLNAAHHEQYAYLSPLAVFDEIREILKAKSVYEWLRQDVVGRYHDHEAFLKQVEQIYLAWVDEEVRESLGLAREASHGEMFTRYVTHVSHWVKHEKLLDPTSGAYKDPDKTFMGEIEQVLLGDGEKAEDFRRAIIGTIGARALEHPNEKQDYAVLFKSYVQRLREDFFDKRKAVITKGLEAFLKLTATEEKHELDAKDEAQARAMSDALEKRFGYIRASARDTVAYVLKKKYAE